VLGKNLDRLLYGVPQGVIAASFFNRTLTFTLGLDLL